MLRGKKGLGLASCLLAVGGLLRARAWAAAPPGEVARTG